MFADYFKRLICVPLMCLGVGFSSYMRVPRVAHPMSTGVTGCQDGCDALQSSTRSSCYPFI